MPELNLGQIMSLATTDCGRRADIPLSEVSLRANLAYQEVAGSVPHALLEKTQTYSTVSGTSSLTLPADFGEPINVSMTWLEPGSTTSSHATLNRISASALDAIGNLPVGEPSGIVFFANTVELSPSADSAYSVALRYRAAASDMTATTAVPSISTPWRYAIVLKLKELLYDYLNNPAAALVANQQYVNYCAHTKTDEARLQSGQLHFGMAPIYQTSIGGRGRAGGSSHWTLR